jgi:1,4-dihydroxy-2-naphthoate octaprenyltransferase
LWIKGARPRTLPAAIAPVVVGTACINVESSSTAVWSNAIFALIVSLALQVAVNYANDYSDGVRGTDDKRVGPLRLVGSGAKTASAVKRAAFLSFGVAAIFGLILAVLTSLWLLVVGALCILAGWFYTGGKKPYGYFGLGEVFVFVFFGLVATTGTTFVIIEKLTITSFIASLVVGALACALLAVNNLRDIDGDTLAGKRTLAVRLGVKKARSFYISLFVLALLAILVLALSYPLALFGLVGLASAFTSIKRVRSGAVGGELISVLSMTGRTQILTAITLSIGLILS